MALWFYLFCISLSSRENSVMTFGVASKGPGLAGGGLGHKLSKLANDMVSVGRAVGPKSIIRCIILSAFVYFFHSNSSETIQ